MGFKEHLLKIKMDYAGKTAVPNTTMTGNLASRLLGGIRNFINQVFFSQMFRQLMGTTPSEYRK